MTEQKNIGALSGIKVIDLTRVLSGPFCTMLLADMGAEVIKIEPPKGDNVRNQGDMVDGYSSYFAQFNRNKKSVILDLYKDTEKEILKSLISEADVVVENFKGGVFKKMGFDFETLKSLNPRIISASVNGFGSKGEMSEKPAFDFIAQALSVIGAGSLVGIDVLQSSLLAGLLGVANVLEILARKYLNDGQLTIDEVNQAFGILDSKTHNDMNGREI